MLKWIRSLLTVGLMGLATPVAIAQEYPTKPITLIVPFAPGGSSDLISRLLGQKLTEAFKQQVIVDNRGGGAGFVGMQAAARAAPDGYTLILGHIGTLAVNPAMFAKMPYKVDEFAPVTLVATVPNVLVVSPALPAKTFQEFIKLAKEKPGTLNYGSAGIGSAGHLAMEYLKQKTGIEMSHVPYKGTGPMITDLLSGQTQATFTGAPPLMPHIKADKLRPLAVGSAKRLETLPDVPSVAEQDYPGFETSQWYGILAPAKTPAPIVQKLAAEIHRALQNPEVIERFQHDGSIPTASTPEEFAAFIEKEAKLWGDIVKAAGIQPN
jgi:tripartite-type tricarboxylate transporter receptor subunit TctC